MPKKTSRSIARSGSQRRSKPEIVAKLGHWLLENRDGLYTSYPLLTLLCNREGYMALSRIFARRAKEYDRAMRRAQQDDHDHEHLVAGPNWSDEFNVRLSDLIELRLVSLFPSTRRVTLGYYGATVANAKKGDASETLIGIAKRARKDQRETRASFAEIDARLQAETDRRKPGPRNGAKGRTKGGAAKGKDLATRPRP